MPKELPINSQVTAIVDDDMFDYLSQFKWRIDRNGYILRGTRKNGHYKNIWMHQEVISVQEGFKADHIDRNKYNNTRKNLREATPQQNRMNQPAREKGVSQYKGVSWHKRVKRWVANLGAKGHKKHLGCFDTEIEAAKAYDKRAKELFGEFAYLNFPSEAQDE